MIVKYRRKMEACSDRLQQAMEFQLVVEECKHLVAESFICHHHYQRMGI